jgi:hypothetical protein
VVGNGSGDDVGASEEYQLEQHGTLVGTSVGTFVYVYNM